MSTATTGIIIARDAGDICGVCGQRVTWMDHLPPLTPYMAVRCFVDTVIDGEDLVWTLLAETRDDVPVTVNLGRRMRERAYVCSDYERAQQLIAQEGAEWDEATAGHYASHRFPTMRGIARFRREFWLEDYETVWHGRVIILTGAVRSSATITSEAELGPGERLIGDSVYYSAEWR